MRFANIAGLFMIEAFALIRVQLRCLCVPAFCPAHSP